jgi:transcriptional regulator with XRE-family HTH domain
MDTEGLEKAINAAVGAELRGLRAKRGMSRPELSALSGLGYSTIQRIENGDRSPDLQQLARLARALKVPVHEFVTSALKDVDGIE